MHLKLKNNSKMKKDISIKPILAIIKEIKSDRHISQERINGFNSELAEKISRQNILLQELGESQSRITELRHLVKMYQVIDSNKIHGLWKLEKACGITDKNCPDWEFEFRKTKDGFNLKS